MKSSFRSSSAVRASGPPAPTSLPAAFSEQLSALYQRVQQSDYVFGSPLGPFMVDDQELYLPRFVYFGPNSTDASLRLAFFAGFDHRDLRPTLSLLRLVEGLAFRPDIGQGLDVSLFPLLDVAGLARRARDRRLSRQNWARPTAPEVALLEQDARRRAYHGFVSLETAAGEDTVVVRLRAPTPLENFAPSLELISSDDLAPVQVRWESEQVHGATPGPLGIADDLPLHPFELLVRIPGSWPLDRYAETAAAILKRFVIRYRAFISYAQHL